MGLPPGEHWMRSVKEGFAQLPTPPVRAAAGASVDVLVRMEPARVLRGRVLSSRLGLLANARVELTMPQPGAALSVRTDASGAFRIGPLSRGSYTLEVNHPAHAGFGRTVTTGESPLIITLEPLASVQGRIVDSQTDAAVPIEHLSVLVSRDDQEGPWQSLDGASWHAADGLDTGCFRVYARTRRFLKVIVYSDGCAPTASPPFRLNAGGEPGPMLLSAQPGVRVRGQLMDDEDRPLPGGEITLMESSIPHLVVASLRCGSEGGFVSSPLAPGHYALRARSPGYLTETIEEVVVPSDGAPDPLRIHLRAAGRIRGCVAARPEGVLPRLWVTARRLDTVESAWLCPPTVQVHDRRFAFPALEPGKYRLELRGQDVTAPSRFPPLAVVQADVRAGRRTTVSLDLLGIGSFLTGLFLRQGSPQASAEVIVEGEDQRLAWRCVTDAEGRFHFAALPSGAYRISHAADSTIQRTLQVNGPPARLSYDLGR